MQHMKVEEYKIHAKDAVITAVGAAVALTALLGWAEHPKATASPIVHKAMAENVKFENAIPAKLSVNPQVEAHNENGPSGP